MMNRDRKTPNRIMAPEGTLGGTDFDNPAFPPDVSSENRTTNAGQNLKADSVRFYKWKIKLLHSITLKPKTDH